MNTAFEGLKNDPNVNIT